MSDFRAISGVSETLQTLLLDRMELPDGVAGVPVTVGPPSSSKDLDPQQEQARLNLFLYRVTENGFLQNQEIPGRGAPGSYGHPPLSLNLHYLLTPYGNVERSGGATPKLFDDTTAQRLLGSAMRVLHDIPVVTDGLTTVRAPSGRAVLHTSLRGEFERIKITLESLSLEDVTKVWTALTLRYRLSAAYVASVVQIESRAPRTFPRPVGQPTSTWTAGPVVHLLTVQTPTVTEVRVRRAGDTGDQPFPYARIGDTVVLRGSSLAGPETTVVLDDVRVPASAAQGDRVEAVIPDSPLLQPGVRTVRVIASDPTVPHSAFASNNGVFMLVPSLDPATLVYQPGPPRHIVVTGTRLLGQPHGGETMIGRSAISRADYLAATPARLTVPVPDTLPATGVQVLVGTPLPDPVLFGGATQTLAVDISGTTSVVTANLPASVPRTEIAARLASLIHDAAPADHRFATARVTLWNDRLLVVPGGLVHPVTITSPSPSTFADQLGLTGPPPPGAASASVSGTLASPPLLTSVNPRVTVTIAGSPSAVIPVGGTDSLTALATDFQAAIRAAGTSAGHTGAQVAVIASQLLVIPGTADLVTFTATPDDDTTVAELQLHAEFAVRVRVNGAESTDRAYVELPR